MIIIKTAEQKNLAYRCLKTILNPEFIDDIEFGTVMGISKAEVKNIVDNWDTVDLTNKDTQLAIYSAFLNLWGYPHGKQAELERYIGVSSEELDRVFDTIRTKP